MVGADEAAAAGASDAQKEQLRFEVELEFVQCLSSPAYLNHLAGTNVLEDERVVAYLKYLLYWRQPEYAKFIRFPHCLYFLELLQDKGFRDKLKSPAFADLMTREQFNHWLFFRGKPGLSPEEAALAKQREEELARAGGAAAAESSAMDTQ